MWQLPQKAATCTTTWPSANRLLNPDRRAFLTGLTAGFFCACATGTIILVVMTKLMYCLDSS